MIGLLLRIDRNPRRSARTALHRLIIVGVLATICSSAYANCSEFERKFIIGPHFAPAPKLVDGPPPLIFCNLRPHETIGVTSLMLTNDKKLFSSTQTFGIADGELNTAKQAPIAGSYAGVEPQGYFWSMTETRDPPRDMLADLARDALAIVVRTGTVSTKIDRYFGRWRATARDIRQDGIVGKLFIPKQPRWGRGTVVILPGPGGPKFQTQAAYLLAARGFTVFSLPYYGVKGLPQQLESIPIEYFSRAIDYLRREYIGENGKLVLLGISRGTEAAAMLAQQREDIDGLVLFSPSSVLNSGGETGVEGQVPAWTLRGSPLRFMPSVEGEDDVMQAQTPPYRTSQRYVLRLDRLAADDPARIPFENIKSDVVLLACDQDEVWPAARMSAEAVERAKRRGKRNIGSYVFRGCGHDLGAPVAPTTVRDIRWPSDGPLYALGGTAQATWHAQQAAWSLLLKHLGAPEEN